MKQRLRKRTKFVLDPSTPKAKRIYAGECHRLFQSDWSPTQFHYARKPGLLIRRLGERVTLPMLKDSAFWTTYEASVWFANEINRLEGLA